MTTDLTPSEARREIEERISPEALDKWNGCDQSTVNDFVCIALWQGVDAAVEEYEAFAAGEDDDDDTPQSYHVSNLGDFGRGLQTDLDGYVHLTAEAWLSAPMDWGTEGPSREMAEELAERAREATESAERDIAAWRESQ